MTRKCFWKSALPVFLFIAGSHLALDQHGSLGIHKAEAGITEKISGTVRDAKTREPLPGVNLVLEGTTQGAASDAQGDYFIANVPPGTYTLKVSLLGYAAVTVTGVRVRVDATTELNFAGRIDRSCWKSRKPSSASRIQNRKRCVKPCNSSGCIHWWPMCATMAAWTFI